MGQCTSCDKTLENLGSPGCLIPFGVPVAPIIVPTKDSDGNFNEIDIASYTGSQSEWDARTQNLDRTQRYFPLPAMKNVNDVRAEDRTESFEDESTVSLGEGPRTYTAEIVEEANPELLKSLKSWKCQKFSMFLRDDCGNLWGVLSPDGTKFRPFRINRKTWSARWASATGTTATKLLLTFEFNKFIKDENMRVFNADQSEIDLLEDIEGLVDVEGEVVSGTISQTGVTVDLKFDNGSAVLKPLEGLVLADFTLLQNLTDDLPVTILTATESATTPGRYALTFASQDVSDELELSFIAGLNELEGLKWTVV